MCQLEPGGTVSVCLEARVELHVELQTVGELSKDGMRALHVRVNGQPRPVQVGDRSVQVRENTGRRADPGGPRHVGAALPGLVMPKVAVDDRVTKGQALAVVEARKMVSTVSSPADGTVAEVAVAAGTNVEVGDRLVVLADKRARRGGADYRRTPEGDPSWPEGTTQPWGSATPASAAASAPATWSSSSYRPSEVIP